MHAFFVLVVLIVFFSLFLLLLSVFHGLAPVDQDPEQAEQYKKHTEYNGDDRKRFLFLFYEKKDPDTL